jgi:hypothetical protein
MNSAFIYFLYLPSAQQPDHWVIARPIRAQDADLPPVAGLVLFGDVDHVLSFGLKISWQYPVRLHQLAAAFVQMGFSRSLVTFPPTTNWVTSRQPARCGVPVDFPQVRSPLRHSSRHCSVRDAWRR